MLGDCETKLYIHDQKGSDVRAPKNFSVTHVTRDVLTTAAMMDYNLRGTMESHCARYCASSLRCRLPEIVGSHPPIWSQQRSGALLTVSADVAPYCL